jgi:hypothetical protein
MENPAMTDHTAGAVTAEGARINRRGIASTADRLSAGIVTRANAADVMAAANHVLAAADALVTALERLQGAPNRMNRQAEGRAEEALVDAVHAYRRIRPETDAARDAFLAAYPTPAAMQAALNERQAATRPPTIG